MRLWMVWAVLAVIWSLQATAAALVHNQRYAITMYAMSVFFAIVGAIVRKRTPASPVAASASPDSNTRKARANSRSKSRLNAR